MGKMSVEKVGLKEQVAWMGGKEYWYELEHDKYGEEMLRKWFTTSKKYVCVDGEKVSIKELDKLDPGNTEWTPAERRVKNPKKLKLLNEIVDRAQAAKRKEDGQRKKQQAATQDISRRKADTGKNGNPSEFQVIALKKEGVKVIFRGKVFLGRPMEVDQFGRDTDEYEFAREIGDPDEVFPTYEEVPSKLRKLLERVRRKHLHKDSAPSEQPPRRPTTTATASKVTGNPKSKRTKYGIRIFSSDGKHFFDFGCWPSRKYPGHSSIRLGIAGKRKLYTISQRDWKAMLEELQRGKPSPPPTTQGPT